MENNILHQLLSPENALRKRAEETLMTQRDQNPHVLLNLLIEGMKAEE
jgi:hypothetical protein